jgi:RNA polymerase sigma-70 factor (ECF subfamily)
MNTSENHSTPSDEVLVEAAKGGDLAAFEELVARHRDKVYARALTMLRNEDEALELAQDTWVKSWQRLGQFQGDSSFATWLMRIVINRCLDHMRSRQRHPMESLDQWGQDSGPVECQLPAVAVSPTASLELAELRQKIDAAIQQLTPEHRTVLVLHEFEEMAYKEIAKTIGCSIGTVMSRLFYARRRMAGLLADQREYSNCPV